MKTIGIIGGLGPETTSKFYLRLITLSRKLNKIERPKIIIYNVPLPYIIEKEAIVDNQGMDRCLPYLISAAKILKKAGAEILVMPCNTLHTYIEYIRNSVNIPVISIIEETVSFLKRKGIAKIGIISTSITIKNKLYTKKLEKENIICVLPNKLQSVAIGRIIYNLVSGRRNTNDRLKLLEIINVFNKNNINNVILACTDLQLINIKNPQVSIFDTMEILAKATVIKALA